MLSVISIIEITIFLFSPITTGFTLVLIQQSDSFPFLTNTLLISISLVCFPVLIATSQAILNSQYLHCTLASLSLQFVLLPLQSKLSPISFPSISSRCFSIIVNAASFTWLILLLLSSVIIPTGEEFKICFKLFSSFSRDISVFLIFVMSLKTITTPVVLPSPYFIGEHVAEIYFLEPFFVTNFVFFFNPIFLFIFRVCSKRLLINCGLSSLTKEKTSYKSLPNASAAFQLVISSAAELT